MRSLSRPSLLVSLLVAALFCASLFVLYSGERRWIKFQDVGDAGLLGHEEELEDLLPSWKHLDVVKPTNQITWPYRRYKSSPLRPPNITIEGDGGELADGFIFFIPKNRGGAGHVKQIAPFIMTSDGDLVYAGNEFTGSTNDIRVQSIGGEPHLTLWQGTSTNNHNPGHGYGRVLMLDDQYRKSHLNVDANITTLMKNPEDLLGVIDIHEHHMTPRDSMLVTVYNNTPVDLSAIDGPKDGWVQDSMFYDIDVATEEILFSWSPLAHIPVNASRLPIDSYMGNGSHTSPYDFFHTNSIQAIGPDYLISSRHMWSIYLISGTTGEILWHLDGSGNATSSFGPLPPAAQFRWQHDAHAHSITPASLQLSLFDNHATEDDHNTSYTKGLELFFPLPPSPKTSPKLLRAIENPEAELLAQSQGSYQILPNGNRFLGYGQIPVMREYGPDPRANETRWQARFGYDNLAQSYRAYKQVWHATPADWDPVAVVRKAATQGDDDDEAAGLLLELFVSWNGATEVERWAVYVGASEREQAEHREGLIFAGEALKKGFETRIGVRVLKEDACVVVAAVVEGKEVRRSEMVCLK